MKDRAKSELISQILERLSQDRFEIENYGEGEIVTVKNYGPTIVEIEQYFGYPLRKLYPLQDKMLSDVCAERAEFNDLLHGIPLELHWSNWWTFQLFNLIFGEERCNECNLSAPSHLETQDYVMIITELYEEISKAVTEKVKTIFQARVSLSGADVERIEHQFLTVNSPDEQSDRLAGAVALRLSRVFPKLVHRTEQLRLLPVDMNAPDEVRRYLAEATWCFIYGQFVACLIVCRSAIELALRDCLVRYGKRKELAILPTNQLWDLLALAKKELPYHFRPTLDAAEQVRITANDAVHESGPAPEVCRAMFEATRGVLRELYSTSTSDHTLGFGD